MGTMNISQAMSQNVSIVTEVMQTHSEYMFSIEAELICSKQYESKNKSHLKERHLYEVIKNHYYVTFKSLS